VKTATVAKNHIIQQQKERTAADKRTHFTRKW